MVTGRANIADVTQSAQLARAIAYSDLISIIVLRVTASFAIGFVREDLDGVIQVNWPIFAPDVGACPAGIRAEIDGTRATFTCSGPKPQLVAHFFETINAADCA